MDEKIIFLIILCFVETKQSLVSVFPISPSIYIYFLFTLLLILYILDKFFTKITFNSFSKLILFIGLLINSDKFVVGWFLILGLLIRLTPIPTIKNSFPETEIISCKIPLIFFLLINKSLGFLNNKKKN